MSDVYPSNQVVGAVENAPGEALRSVERVPSITLPDEVRLFAVHALTKI